MTQATALRWEAADRSGAVVTDAGHELVFDGAAVSPAVRLLRPGQRVDVLVEAGRVVALSLPGMPPPGAHSAMMGP